ncbi:MAG TPA: hypothetical protein PKU96_00235 [bacterium]|nr:hypothetical protein [Myxococcales bacterium]OQA60922.1 MAG: hypothetical protein BWY40_00820 [bacterium ADurb.Bin270]HPW44785.1 hypothetical protein [bacterium]HQC51147.1 hypothetical protein [bacterium]HQG12796.1 hypothetical protein [bacterium]
MVREVSGNLRPIQGTKTPYTPKIVSHADDSGDRATNETNKFAGCTSLNDLTGGRDRRSQGNPLLTRK